MACALNTYLADTLEGLADRMTAVAVIPTHTPEEAMVELDHAVVELGFKAVMLNSYVPRPLADLGPGAQWLDVLALDSIYDYDPVWARCVELGVAVTVHAPTHGSRAAPVVLPVHVQPHRVRSPPVPMRLPRPSFFGGVTHRFPTLNFASWSAGCPGACSCCVI